MGIKLMSHTESPTTTYTSDFKVLDNKNGKICSTYPAILVVPSRMPYDALVRCARFRSRERLPAMSFAYEYEKDKFAVVYRSSQSKVGVQNNRSSDDELMLRMIGNHKLDPKSTISIMKMKFNLKVRIVKYTTQEIISQL
jgi:myotubularin-related protein 1/2